jgi:Ca2+-transporting ATPase
MQKRETGPAWHTLEREAVLEHLQSRPSLGLSASEARLRLERHGPNVLETQGSRHWSVMLLAQFTDFMILVLLAAAVVAGAVGGAEDSIAIVVIVVLNAVIGFVQEYRAEKAMAALRRMAPHAARVVRDGDEHVVPAEQLVPGDIVSLEAGDVVPADVRLLDTARLQTEEAALTGESLPVEKNVAAISDADAPLGERTGMAYKGTLITHGRGRGVVVATGMLTELGHIAQLLSADEGKTPLQRRLAQFGRRLALVVLVLCTILFAIGWLRGEPPVTMFLTAVSLAVAAIPEALPAIVTVALALGAARMVKQNALVKRLPAVETLGSVTYICSDKTGTLTENRMRVESCYAGGHLCQALPGGDACDDAEWSDLALVMALCNDAYYDAGGELRGDPTETALLEAVPRAVSSRRRTAYPRIAELPFDATRARMTTFHPDGEAVVALVKGAPESVLPRCIAAPGDEQLDEALKVVERLAARGERILAFALKRLEAVPETCDPEAVERDLTFVGLVGLVDPPRPEAASAVAACQAAGITPVMITGDHASTAAAIAARLGIGEPGAIVMTGRELKSLADEELAAKVRQVRVFARTSPAQKIRIVDALQRAGELVAMTGDGVNDAPALKRADIGVAMGRIGTDVAREAAAMVLLDDNFATIVRAVREGRRIFDNIRKFVRFVLGGNTGEILTLFIAPLAGMPIPLLPIHILWVNLVTDGLPGLALAAERAEPDAMREPPRPPGESLFARGVWQHVLWVGALIAVLTLGVQAWAVGAGIEHWQSLVFTVLTFAQMSHVLAVRAERVSVFSIGFASNRPLIAAVLLTIGLQLAILYVPFARPIFHTAPLSAGELGICALAAAVVFFAVEIEKWLTRVGLLYRRSLACT